MNWHKQFAGALAATITVALLATSALPLGAGVPESAPGTNTFLPKLQGANELIGLSVKNSKDESLGTVKDIVLRSGTDRVSYYVLSFGGILGIGDKYLAVPWSAVRLSAEGGKHLICDIPKDRLKDAPGFPKDRWPDMADPALSATIHDYYGIKHEAWAPGETGVSFWSRRLTKLIGTPVKDFKGEVLGEVEDVTIDTGEGQLAYCVLSVGGFLGFGEKLCAVPWGAVEFLPSLRTARFDADRDTLKKLAFSRDKFPDLSNLALAESTHKLFNLQPYWEMLSGRAKRDPMADWQVHSDYNKLFDTAKVGTYEGVISSLGTFVPGRGAADGVRIVIVTDDGHSYTIHTGPASYVENANVQFNYGDRIKVTGSLVKWHGASIVMAVEIHKGDAVVRFREATGRPLWPLPDEGPTVTKI